MRDKRPAKVERLRGVDLSGGTGESVASYIDVWLDAVRTESRRLLHVRSRHRRADALLLIFALHQLHVAVQFAAYKMDDGSLDTALGHFESHFAGGLKAARDAIVHFDEWRAGQGRGQTVEPDGSFMFFHSLFTDTRQRSGRVGTVAVHLRKGGPAHQFHLPDAVEQAERLARAAHAEIDRYVGSFR